MRIEILDESKEDLVAGFQFYEKQSPGLGSYFLDSLFADIDSLLLYAGIHRLVYGSHRCIASRFPFAITTASKVMSSASAPSSIAAAIPPGFGDACKEAASYDDPPAGAPGRTRRSAPAPGLSASLPALPPTRKKSSFPHAPLG